MIIKRMLKKGRGIIKSAFKSVSDFISSVFNFIFLLIVYLIGIGPVSLIMKLFGKHFLELRKSSRKSNWTGHKVTREPLDNYYRSF